MIAVDLNADLGESVDGELVGDDRALFALVSSASIATGGHAGDDPTMSVSCRDAARRSVRIGAHVSYPDRDGFGRRDIEIESDRLRALVLEQIATLREHAARAGSAVAYVKPHGALYNRIVHDEEQADAVALAAASAGLPLLGLPDSAIERAARRHGTPFFREAFVDRGYRADGALVPRSQPGALIVDPVAAAARAVELVTTGSMPTESGDRIRVEVDSLCVHGDSPGAVEMARTVRTALERAGVTIAPFANGAAVSRR